MKLVGSLTSPYVRKIRVLLAERRIAHEFLEESAWTATTTVPRYNPLNKVPALQLDDGECLYDSAVIAEYLDAISGGALLPAEPRARARVHCLEALGDGIIDAGVTAFLERKRETSRQDATWIARQLDKVHAGIRAMGQALGDAPFLAGSEPGLADYGCGSGLFWLEFRLPEIRWREGDARLRAWAERLEARPSFKATRPPG